LVHAFENLVVDANNEKISTEERTKNGKIREQKAHFK